MNVSYACYVVHKTNSADRPSWMSLERYDFCECITRFFSRLKK